MAVKKRKSKLTKRNHKIHQHPKNQIWKIVWNWIYFIFNEFTTNSVHFNCFGHKHKWIAFYIFEFRLLITQKLFWFIWIYHWAMLSRIGGVHELLFYWFMNWFDVNWYDDYDIATEVTASYGTLSLIDKQFIDGGSDV